MEFLTEITPYELIAQAIGFIGFAIYSTAAYRRCRKKLFAQEAGGAVVIGTHSLMLGSVIGLVINLIYTLMSIMGRYHPETRVTRRNMVIIMGLFALTMMFFWSGNSADYFCVAGTVIGFWARGLKNTTHLRLTASLSTFVWLGFNFAIGSWSGIIFGLISIFGHLKSVAKSIKVKPTDGLVSMGAE